jgi:ribokinase
LDPVALFAGDLSLDATMGIPHVPAPDEKLRVTSFAEAPGGVVTNAAVAAHRSGLDVRLLLHVGDDIASRAVPPLLRAQGLALDVEESKGALCRAMILVDPGGEKRLILYPGHSMYPTPAQAKGVSLDGVAWLHTAIYEPEAAALLIARCRAAHVPFSIDLEPVTFREGIDTLARHIAGAETVFCNSRAADQLNGDAVKKLEAIGAKSVVLTQGPDGASWCSQGKVLSVFAPKVEIKDTTGAGDCLAGWFVAETLRGAGPKDALRTAVAAATWSCARLGAQASFPQRTDIAGLLPS